MTKRNKNKWWLNGGRGSGRTFSLLWETYENKIANLQRKVDTLQGFLDHDIEYDMDKTIQELRRENAELKEKIEVLECDNYNANCNLNLITDYLTKARGLLARWVELYKPKLEGYPITPIQEQAEQFLKEIEK